MKNTDSKRSNADNSVSRSKLFCRIAAAIILSMVASASVIVVSFYVYEKTVTVKSTPAVKEIANGTTTQPPTAPAVRKLITKKCPLVRTSGACECSKEPIRNMAKLPRGARIKGRVSLGIAIDSTGSMDSEMTSVKQGAVQLLKKNKKYKVFDDFLIVTFNDPYVSDVQRTTDADEALRIIENLSNPTGGKDCPEYSLTGILKIVKKAKPGSFIFVFTDASAKDRELMSQILKIINTKKITVHFIATGRLCSKGLNYPTYRNIADAQGGTIIQMEKTRVLDVMSFLTKALRNGKNALYDLPTTGGKLRELISLIEKCKCPPPIFERVCSN